MDVFDGLTFENEGDSQDIDIVLQTFEAFCIGKCNETYDHYLFNTLRQGEDVKIDTYIALFRKLAKTCNYSTLEDDLIRDRIVSGIRDSELRKRLLQQDKLTLEKAVDMCRAYEATTARVEVMTDQAGNRENKDEKQIHFVKCKGRREHKSTHKQIKHNGNRTKRLFKYCGSKCDEGKCPAYGNNCNNGVKETTSLKFVSNPLSSRLMHRMMIRTFCR